MNILKNRYFILGNLFLILISIPITLFFIKKQQEVRSRAAPSSKLYFQPSNPNTSTQCASFTVDVMLDPGQNIVSIVDLGITYDATKLDLISIVESNIFSSVVKAQDLKSGSGTMSVSVGVDVTKAAQTTSKVATLTFKALAQGTAELKFDTAQTKAFSLSTSDSPTENVLSTTTPASVTITTDTCTTGQAASSPSPSPTPTATTIPNQPPVCTEFTVTPQNQGTAPFAVQFSAKGNDSDGTVSKATFVYGDGNAEDVTENMNVQSVTTQKGHTYQNAGTYSATATFTDNGNTISQACTLTITVSASSGGTATPTATLIPTETIAPTGNFGSALGIMGGIILTIVGVALLFAL